MKILLVAWYFPPYNAIGAVRASKLAKSLLALGHDVRVLTGGPQPLPDNLPLEIPPERVLRTPWLNVNAPAELALGGRERVAQRGFHADPTPLGRLAASLKPLYKNLLHLPDAQIGWLPFAVSAAAAQLRPWKPDLLFASALPVSALLVAAALSALLDAPWVAELRDLPDDPVYYGFAPWRRPLDTALLNATLRTASGLVTVSDPLLEDLQRRVNRPGLTVLNGFDPEDFPTPRLPPFDDGRVHLVYTGQLYDGKRDPRPLFQALRDLKDQAEPFHVHFYGRSVEPARAFAQDLGVAHRVHLHDPIPYRDALAAQAAADLLLFLLHDHPDERGVFTGKLFEYLGAQRPILALGRHDNVACQLIQERGAGAVSLDPHTIAQHLLAWRDQKQTSGAIPTLPDTIHHGLTRHEQNTRLARFLQEIAAAPSQTA